MLPANWGTRQAKEPHVEKAPESYQTLLEDTEEPLLKPEEPLLKPEELPLKAKGCTRDHGLVKSLLRQDEETLVAILVAALEARPELWEALDRRRPAITAAPAPMTGIEEDGGSGDGSQPPAKAPPAAEAPAPTRRAGSKGGASSSVLQFSSSVYLCREEDKQAVLTVLRVGGVQGEAQVRYATSNGTAVAGRAYVKTQGVLAFGPMEAAKTIVIPILDNQEWSSVLDFRVELLGDGLSGATLEKSLYHTVVKLVDSDVFPTKRFSKEILSGGLSGVSDWRLFLEYCKMQWGNDAIRLGTIKTLIVDFLGNVYFVLRSFAQMYLVDCILDSSWDEEKLLFVHDRRSSLMLIGLVYVLHCAFAHVSAYHKPFGVGGVSRLLLQKGVFARFLNYSAAARSEVHSGELLMALARDALQLVQDGYKGMLKAADLIGEIFAIAVIRMVAPRVFGREFDIVPVLTLIGFPMVLAVFVVMREGKTMKFINDRDRKQDDLMDWTGDAIDNFQLIADINCGPICLDWCEARITAYNKARKAAKLRLINNKEFSAWLAALLVAVYIVHGGLRVFHEELSLGIYLTNISILQQMGKAYSQLYETCLNIQGTFPPLVQLTYLMNLPTSLSHRMEHIKAHHNLAEKLMPGLQSKAAEAGEPQIDLLPIEIGDVEFSYNTASSPGTAHMAHRINFARRASFQQGDFVYLSGPHGEGKTTLLKLLAGVILPEEVVKVSHVEDAWMGSFVPPHLSSIHLPSEPHFFQMSLMDNLLLGLGQARTERLSKRAVRICERIGLSQTVMDYVQGDEVMQWKEVLSHTESTLLSLARAFVANPEILCIERHWMNFSAQTAERVQDLLREHVEQRGLEEEEAQMHLRRPRTCVMTYCRGCSILPADKLFHVDSSGIKELGACSRG